MWVKMKMILARLRPAKIIFILTFLLVGCTSPVLSPTVKPTETRSPTETVPAPETLTPSPSATHIPTSTITPTLAIVLCSPLEGISLAELPTLMTGDIFQPPLPGRDDGHHGIDFAFYRHGALTTMLGLPIQAIMSGKVAAVINNRKPYGNAIIIETSLDTIPTGWAEPIKLPTPAPTVIPDPRLTCPKPQAEPWMTPGRRALYHLYAHMNKPSPLKVGDTVACGQVIGEVGTSGNSVNPHLHLETRLGPAGATFTSLGHYDTLTTEEERSNYCTWRVSGWFQMFDPMLLLSQTP